MPPPEVAKTSRTSNILLVRREDPSDPTKKRDQTSSASQRVLSLVPSSINKQLKAGERISLSPDVANNIDREHPRPPQRYISENDIARNPEYLRAKVQIPETSAAAVPPVHVRRRKKSATVRKTKTSQSKSSDHVEQPPPLEGELEHQRPTFVPSASPSGYDDDHSQSNNSDTDEQIGSRGTDNGYTRRSRHSSSVDCERVETVTCRKQKTTVTNPSTSQAAKTTLESRDLSQVATAVVNIEKGNGQKKTNTTRVTRSQAREIQKELDSEQGVASRKRSDELRTTKLTRDSASEHSSVGDGSGTTRRIQTRARARQEELDRSRQEGLDRARQEELDRARQEGLDRARQEELDRRQEELDRAQEELDRAQEELDRAQSNRMRKGKGKTSNPRRATESEASSVRNDTGVEQRMHRGLWGERVDSIQPEGLRPNGSQTQKRSMRHRKLRATTQSQRSGFEAEGAKTGRRHEYLGSKSKPSAGTVPTQEVSTRSKQYLDSEEDFSDVPDSINRDARAHGDRHVPNQHPHLERQHRDQDTNDLDESDCTSETLAESHKSGSDSEFESSDEYATQPPNESDHELESENDGSNSQTNDPYKKLGIGLRARQAVITTVNEVNDTIYIAVSGPEDQGYRAKVGSSKRMLRRGPEHDKCGFAILWAHQIPNAQRVERLVHAAIQTLYKNQETTDIPFIRGISELGKIICACKTKHQDVFLTRAGNFEWVRSLILMLQEVDNVKIESLISEGRRSRRRGKRRSTPQLIA